MAIVSILVFGAALMASVWTIWATVAPQSARIIDLLVNGPEYALRPVTVISARNSVRDVRVRRVVAPQVSGPVPLRAAA